MEAADKQRVLRDAFDRPAGLFDADGNRLDITVEPDAPDAAHDGTVAD